MFVKSRTHAGLGGDACAQVFTTQFEFLKFFPMKSKAEAGHNLDKFIHEVGVMKHLHIDGAKEESDAVCGVRPSSITIYTRRSLSLIARDRIGQK
jgi:hypothetical protein